MKVSGKHVYVYLYLTNNYDFVSTYQNNNVLKYNITMQHWWDMSSLQQKSLVFQSHYTIFKKLFSEAPYKMHKYKRTEVICGAWYCPYCAQAIFPFNHFDDDDDFYSAVIEGMLDCSFKLQEINNKIFTPFEINDSFDTPFADIDPD